MYVKKALRVALLALCLAGAGCPSDSPSEEDGTSGASGGGGGGSGGSSSASGLSALLDELADVSYEADQVDCECREDGDDCPAERVSETRLDCMKEKVLAYEDQAQIKGEIECMIEAAEQEITCLESRMCDAVAACEDGPECPDAAWEAIGDCD